MMTRHIIINRTSETVLRFLPLTFLSASTSIKAIAALDQILTSLTSTGAVLVSGEHSHGQ